MKRFYWPIIWPCDLGNMTSTSIHHCLTDDRQINHKQLIDRDRWVKRRFIQWENLHSWPTSGWHVVSFKVVYSICLNSRHLYLHKYVNSSHLIISYFSYNHNTSFCHKTNARLVNILTQTFPHIMTTTWNRYGDHCRGKNMNLQLHIYKITSTHGQKMLILGMWNVISMM